MSIKNTRVLGVKKIHAVNRLTLLYEQVIRNRKRGLVKNDYNNMEELSSHITKEERREQKKSAQKADAVKARRKKVLKKIGYWIVGLTVVIGSGWFLVNRTGPQGTDYSQTYPILGRNHIADGSTASYNSNPPTSGDHYAAPAPARFYDQELPDEQVVHNLEHGHVWIAYKPSVSGEIIDSLRDFSSGNIIITPRSKNDTDIALAAWGRLDKFNIEASGIDTQRIKDFISHYQNRGPEKINIRGHLR